MARERTTAQSAGPPVQIPGYRLLDKIGEGGMGEVYRARQRRPRRTVAVKVFSARPDDPAPLACREPRLMAALSHPNLVTFYDCGQAGGRTYLVMEYVAGSTLRQRMQPG